MKTPLALRLGIAAVLFLAVTIPMVIASTTSVSPGDAFKEQRMALRLEQSRETTTVSAPQANTAPNGIGYKTARINLAAQREKDQASTAAAIANARISCRQQFPKDTVQAGLCLRDAVKTSYKNRAAALGAARAACLRQSAGTDDSATLLSCVRSLYLTAK